MTMMGKRREEIEDVTAFLQQPNGWINVPGQDVVETSRMSGLSSLILEYDNLTMRHVQQLSIFASGASKTDPIYLIRGEVRFGELQELVDLCQEKSPRGQTAAFFINDFDPTDSQCERIDDADLLLIPDREQFDDSMKDVSDLRDEELVSYILIIKPEHEDELLKLLP